ncbi:MAG: nuclear transport factor 2 family protein [Actinomycetota bacterium]|nr:nuclear transport factor 2 family protein [Actinomycetota bacterium]
MEHPNAQLLRRLFDAFAAGDRETVVAGFAEDVVWRTPGSSELAGEYVGRDAVLAQLGRSHQLTEGTYRIEVEEIMSGDRHATVLYRGTGSRNDRRLDLRHLALYEIAEGAIRNVWVVPLDQRAFDEFWA